VRITYVTHSAFRIETEQGVVIVTDYFGDHGAGRLPDAVTMNHAHSTHYTDAPDPGIPNVLRGWNPGRTGPAEHLLALGDVTIRNVTTDIRGWGAPEKDGNSIFIFEVADLCIGHLGHLHHVLDEAQYAKVGYLDIVMAPVDGSYTLDLPGMIEVLKTLKARLVLPMHAFGRYSLEQFLHGMQDEFAIALNESPTIEVSLDTLPSEPTVLVLPAPGGGAYD
jgi:L-ascorbate metabolism protein UlaG (beta-lactamase superfamily)